MHSRYWRIISLFLLVVICRECISVSTTRDEAEDDSYVTWMSNLTHGLVEPLRHAYDNAFPSDSLSNEKKEVIEEESGGRITHPVKEKDLNPDRGGAPPKDDAADSETIIRITRIEIDNDTQDVPDVTNDTVLKLETPLPIHSSEEASVANDSGSLDKVDVEPISNDNGDKDEDNPNHSVDDVKAIPEPNDNDVEETAQNEALDRVEHDDDDRERIIGTDKRDLGSNMHSLGDVAVDEEEESDLSVESGSERTTDAEGSNKSDESIDPSISNADKATATVVPESEDDGKLASSGSMKNTEQGTTVESSNREPVPPATIDDASDTSVHGAESEEAGGRSSDSSSEGSTGGAKHVHEVAHGAETTNENGAPLRSMEEASKESESSTETDDKQSVEPDTEHAPETFGSLSSDSEAENKGQVEADNNATSTNTPVNTTEGVKKPTASPAKTDSDIIDFDDLEGDPVASGDRVTGEESTEQQEKTETTENVVLETTDQTEDSNEAPVKKAPKEGSLAEFFQKVKEKEKVNQQKVKEKEKVNQQKESSTLSSSNADQQTALDQTTKEASVLNEEATTAAQEIKGSLDNSIPPEQTPVPQPKNIDLTDNLEDKAFGYTSIWGRSRSVGAYPPELVDLVSSDDDQASGEPQQETESTMNSTDKEHDVDSEESTVVDSEGSEEPHLKSVNTQFVEGLDDIDKLFENVPPPDELDVGAAGSSIQEVLMGQGAQILRKRITMGINRIKKLFSGIDREMLKDLVDSACERIVGMFKNLKRLTIDAFDELFGDNNDNLSDGLDIDLSELAALRQQQALQQGDLQEPSDDAANDEVEAFMRQRVAQFEA